MDVLKQVRNCAKKIGFLRSGVALLRRAIGSGAGSNLDIVRRLSGAAAAAEVTVVIPVYNQAELLRRCAESLLAYTPADVELCFIDDCGPEPEIAAVLDEFHRSAPERVTVLKNERNLGFSGTCNRGMAYAGRRDVVLLNSDTVVSPRWLDELRITAYGEKHIGTVSAVSNNSGFVSVPVPPEAGPRPKDDPSQKTIPAPEILAQVGRAYLHCPEIFFDSPTGHGFCMYIKRAMLDEVGELDAATFGRGYGEEVDLCLRAYRLGWTHRITSRVFVWHYNAAAFGDSKQKLVEKSNAVITRRYPEYEFRKELMNSIWSKKRERLTGMADLFRPGVPPVRPRVLYISGVKSGGTFWTNRDLMSQVRDRCEPYLLSGNGRTLELYDFDDPDSMLTDMKQVVRYNLHNLFSFSMLTGMKQVARYDLRNHFSFFDFRSDEMDRMILNWVLRYGIEMIHIRHLAHLSTGFLKAVHRLHIPIIMSFHDFFAISPTVKLMDCRNRFHPEGIQDGETHPDPVTLSKEIDVPPPGIDADLAAWWKDVFVREVFPYCRRFVTTCADARELLMKHFPVLAERADDFVVIPHGRDIEPHFYSEPDISATAPVKIFYLGNCTAAKGGKLLEEVVAADRDHRIRLHAVGAVQPELRESMETLQRAKRVVLHGSYSRGEEAAIARKIRPHIAIIPSLWPETWCHTLTECWAMGIPVLTFDIGALGERMRAIGGGWLLPPDSSPEAVLKEILRIAATPAEYAVKREAVRQWQNGVGRSNTVAKMAAAYKALYAEVMAADKS